MSEEHCGRNQTAFVTSPLRTMRHIELAANMNTVWAWTLKLNHSNYTSLITFAKSHPKLRIGHVECLGVSQSALDTLSSIPYLERLSIGSSDITDLSPLLQCKSLAYLDLGFCDELVNMDCLAQIPTLKLISVHCAPNLESLDAIAAAPNITTLSLTCSTCPIAQVTKGLGKKRINVVRAKDGTKWPKGKINTVHG